MVKPKVSILIPAFKSRWLDVAIASALSQSFSEIEIIVGDDSEGSVVESITRKWEAPELRYFRNPTRGRNQSNLLNLIKVARGDYVKFLFDDDLLLPRSVEVLLRACEESGADMAIHNRHIIDEDGVVLMSPALIEGSAGSIELTSDLFFRHLVNPALNDFGEPSNVMMRASALRQLKEPFGLDDRKFRCLIDMANYANFYASGLRVVGVGGFHSAFRIHGSQNSAIQSPVHAAGIYEWDYLRRWAVDRGFLSEGEFSDGQPALIEKYREHLNLHPGFEDLLQCPVGRPYLSEAFLALIDREDRMVDRARDLAVGIPHDESPHDSHS
ncbi:MAG: glycosyltransferase family 2 protein [Acidimicrobiales bacterium]